MCLDVVVVVVAAVDVDAVAAAASLGRVVVAAAVAVVRSSPEDTAAAGAAEDTAGTAAPGGCTAPVRIVVLEVADIDPKPAVAAHVGSADSGGIAVHLRCLGNIPPTPCLCLAGISCSLSW
jgi:hypothetical protein